MSRPNRIKFAIPLLAAFGLLSIAVYLADRRPESFPAAGPLWILGPSSRALERAAEERLSEGLAALNDSSQPPATRIEAYRSQLVRAEALLERALRANPARARSLASLAAVRWELDPPADEPARLEQLRLIELASKTTPNYGDVQRQLGELLLRMGRRDEATRYLARAASLEPERSYEITRLLRDHLFGAEAIRQALPATAEILVSLETDYHEDGQDALYRERLLQAIDEQRADPRLLVRLGNVSLRLALASETLARLDALEPQAEPAAEGERLYQMARMLGASGDARPALETARRSFAVQPENAARAEGVGHFALAAGEAGEAIEHYSRALSLRGAAAQGDPHSRALLYRYIGAAEEARGRPAVAYDAYARAVSLNPDEPVAARRLREMERDAGFD